MNELEWWQKLLILVLGLPFYLPLLGLLLGVYLFTLALDQDNFWMSLSIITALGLIVANILIPIWLLVYYGTMGQ